MNTPWSELASLLDRWSSYQKAGKTIAGENVVIQQSLNTKPDAINTDKIEVQNKSRRCCNKNEGSSKRRCIDSPLKKYNNRTQNGCADTDCAGTQKPRECLAKAAMASTEDILVSNAHSVSQRNTCANNMSSRLKHLDRTSSILSRIDNCLSKSKNTPLKHNLFPLHQINVKCLDKGVFMSDNDLAGFNCQSIEMADDNDAMLGILTKERDCSNSRTVQSRREMSLEDDTKVIGRGNPVDNGHSLVPELGKTNQTFDKKDINLLPEIPTFKRRSTNDELATIEQTGHRSDGKKDFVETSVKIEEAIHKGCNKNARHCMEGNDIINTNHRNQIRNILSKGDSIEETNFKRSTGIQHINPVNTKEETNKASLSVNTEKMDSSVRTNESINGSNIGTTPNVTDISTFTSERQPDMMVPLDSQTNLQGNNWHFPKRENQRIQTKPGTRYLEDNAIVAVGVGGGNVDTGGATAEVMRPGIDNLDGGIRCAGGADNRDGGIRGAGGADNRDGGIRGAGVADNRDGGIRGAGGADNRDGGIRGAGVADNRDGGIRGAGGADNLDGGIRGAGGADNRDGGIRGAGGADNRDGGIRGAGVADNLDGGIRGAGGADNRDGGIRGAGGADNRDGGIRGAGGADNRDGGIRGEGGADNRDGGIRGAGGADNRDGGIRGAGGADNRDGGIRGAGGADSRDCRIRGAGDTMSDNPGAAVPQKRIKHRWRK